jgi:hypothetical protein
MQQYYTLEEAARLLGATPDELKSMARKGQLRPFQDRGTLRFRAQEIDELARRRGIGSDPDLQLGEVGQPRPADSPAPRKAEEEVEIGGGPMGNESPSKRSGSGRGKPASTKPALPKAGSDSDVRLVADGSDLGFQIADSDIKMVEESGPPSKANKPPSSKKMPKPTTSVEGPDSGVRLIPLEEKSDSDIKLVGDSDENQVLLSEALSKSASDSDIRLEHDSGPSPKGQQKVKRDSHTEEIDLDAELKKAEEKQARKKGSSGAHRAAEPASSPFELSESDLRVPTAPPGSAPGTGIDSSDDFELTPASGRDSSPLELGSDEEIALEHVDLGAPATGPRKGSGINLQDVDDAGISLEPASSGEVEFELTLDSSPGHPAPKTPKPAPKKEEDGDSSSEFELSLDASSPTTDSDSEFELSLDESEAGSVAAEDSDSEFELTLDASGELVSPEEGAEEGEKDIFETDFSVPALDEDSGSEAVALDEGTDVEDSDFDLALGEEDAAADEASGSQVVALEDEEQVDDVEETVAAPRPRLRGGDEEFDELDLERERGEPMEDEEVAPVGRAAPPARWGVFPALVLIPCVIVLFLVGAMTWEMFGMMWGGHQNQKVTGLITPWLAYDVFGMEKPKE